MTRRINIKPLSVNSLFKGRRFKTDKYKAYCTELTYKLKPMDIPEPPFKVVFEFGLSSKLADLDNNFKGCIDILQAYYGFNDRDIFEINAVKVLVAKGEEYIDFSIETYKKWKS